MKVLLIIGMAGMAAFFSGTALAHGNFHSVLSDENVAAGVTLAKKNFEAKYGSWMLSCVTDIEPILSDDRDELEVRVHYVWGSAKFARYFCGFELTGRFECDPAFSGPGAL